MSQTHTMRAASADEMAAEMDRRGAVIEKLEAVIQDMAKRADEAHRELIKQHDARTTELLHANTGYQARARKAEQALASLRAELGVPESGAPLAPLATGETYEIRKSHFGPYIWPTSWPQDRDVILVCADLAEHVPVKIMLRHQFYVRKAVELMTEYGTDKLTIMPYVNLDKVAIRRADLEQRTKACLAEGE